MKTSFAKVAFAFISYRYATVDATETKVIDYSDEWLVWDADRRSKLVSKLAELAVVGLDTTFHLVIM